jgi:ribosomal protein S12 methylthiotransferase accessory factor
VTPAWALDPGLKCDGQGERSVPLWRTEQLLERAAQRLPITRVSDLTPLDPLQLPVFGAVTPLARDLTTHAGKGAGKAQARVSAMMEAVERISAEEIAVERQVRGSYAGLLGGAPRVLDPTSLILPPDTTYGPRRDFTWTRGFDLLGEREVLAPLDAVVSPASEGILRDVDTNGLASGNTLLEAVVHALCEVIERDAISQLSFVEAFGEPDAAARLVRDVEPSSLPATAAAWVERARDHDLSVTVQAVRSDVDLPTFRVLLEDPHFAGISGESHVDFAGYGAHPDAEVALMRGITEAIQSRAGTLQGARDALSITQAARKDVVALPRLQVRFTELPSFPATSLQRDLGLLKARLRSAGLEQLLVFDLTRQDLELPVVRVRVPGLECYLVNQRRVGWRCLRHLLA